MVRTDGQRVLFVYIFQGFSLPAIAIGMKAVHLERAMPINAVILLLAAGSILSGLMAYLLIERPLASLATQLLFTETPATAR